MPDPTTPTTTDQAADAATLGQAVDEIDRLRAELKAIAELADTAAAAETHPSGKCSGAAWDDARDALREVRDRARQAVA